MKGAEGNGCAILSGQLQVSFLHLLCSRSGKGNHQNLAGRHTVGTDQFLNPTGQYKGFSGSRSCQNHHRSIFVHHRFLLRLCHL